MLPQTEVCTWPGCVRVSVTGAPHPVWTYERGPEHHGCLSSLTSAFTPILFTLTLYLGKWKWC